jgi:hypothetical protein
MGVSLRRGEAGMPHKLLDRVGVYSCLGQASGECVAQVVEPEIPHPGFLKRVIEGWPQRVDIDLKSLFMQT